MTVLHCKAKLGKFGDGKPCAKIGSDKYGGRCTKGHATCRHKTTKDAPCKLPQLPNEDRCEIHKRVEKRDAEDVDEIVAGVQRIEIKQVVKQVVIIKNGKQVRGAA